LMTLTAIRHAFLPEAEKTKLLSKAEQLMNC